MKKRKKVLLITLATVLVLTVTAGAVGIAMANDDGTQTVKENLFEKVAQIYQTNTGDTINAVELEKAFTQARTELGAEFKNRIQQRAVDEGKITQEQLDELKEWLERKPSLTTDEFKQWLESRPDMMTEEFKQWWESRPESIPFGFGNHDTAGKRGFNRMGGMFFKRHAPDNAE